MALLRIAIVGRPNVGKSSLLNMLARAKVSIVDPTPGVTRDRVTTVLELPAPDGRGRTKIAEVIDTGGYGVYVAEGARFNDVGEDLTRLTPQIEAQIGEAVRTADLVLFVVDAQVGVTAADEEIATMLRQGSFGRKGRSGPSRAPERTARIIAVANKVDDSSWEPDAAEAAGLGFGAPLMVSAETNYLRRDFVDRLWALLPEEPGRRDNPDTEPALKIVILGKRNAGKSTLVNALAGEERVIVSEIAGTTRDAVDVRFERDGRVFVAIDTAGFRKRKSLAGQVEWWATDRARRALLRADAAMLVLDATTPVSQVDKQLSLEIQRAFKPCVIVVNKWDLVEGTKGPTGKRVTAEHYRTYLDKELGGLDYCPIVFTSAASGADAGGVWGALDLAFELDAQARRRVGTGELNRALRPTLDRMPASKLGRKLKLLFASQIEVKPPTIVLVVNNPDLYTPQHERFLLNRVRESTPFGELPVRLIVRGRRRDEAIEDGVETERRSGAPGRAGPMVEAISEEAFDDADLAGDWPDEFAASTVLGESGEYRGGIGPHDEATSDLADASGDDGADDEDDAASIAHGATQPNQAGKQSQRRPARGGKPGAGGGGGNAARGPAKFSKAVLKKAGAKRTAAKQRPARQSGAEGSGVSGAASGGKRAGGAARTEQRGAGKTGSGQRRAGKPGGAKPDAGNPGPGRGGAGRRGGGGKGRRGPRG